jgi:Tfp pilus assembly protein PilP
MRLAKTVMTGILLATAGSSLHAQSAPAAPPKTAAKPAAQAPAPAQKPAAQAPAPAAKPAAKPATSPAAAPKAAAKPAAQTPAPKAPAPKTPAPAATPKAAAPKAAPAAAKPAKKPAVKKAAGATPTAPGEAPEAKVSRRDPFESLTSRQEAAARAGANLPPGKAGLQVGTLRLDGIVRAPNGMIAVVTNPQARTYFLREGDQLYDGRVEKIAMDGVSFHEVGKDAFGKPVERQVNKRIYSSAGDQQ